MIPGPAILFCPADRPERFGKAASAADGVILDLEDAVSPESKAAAREHIVNSALDPARTIVRVNAVGHPEHANDLAALEKGPFATVMLAKAESASQIDALHAAGYRVVALCETATGIENAGEIARHEGVIALMWGAEDLIASIGGRSSRTASGRYRDVARYARSRVLIAAAAAGKQAIDAVHLDIADVDGLRGEADDAAASGFSASACIHPSQVEAIRSAFAPTAEEIEWATAVLHEASTQPGVFQFRGQMIDEPVLIQARRTLAARIGTP